VICSLVDICAALSGVVIYNYLKMKDSPPFDIPSENQNLPTFKGETLVKSSLGFIIA
jgi:hypothetical protein